MILGRASISRWLSASRNSIPLITGMFQSSSTTSGIAASHCVSASRPSHASERSEEHTSELQSLMRSSYAVFCLKKKKKQSKHTHKQQTKVKIEISISHK